MGELPKEQLEYWMHSTVSRVDLILFMSLLDTIAAREAKIAELEAQVHPIACGHRGADWVELPHDHVCHESCQHGYCLACRREAEIEVKAYERYSAFLRSNHSSLDWMGDEWAASARQKAGLG